MLKILKRKIRNKVIDKYNIKIYIDYYNNKNKIICL